jgi:hypothetical protein
MAHMIPGTKICSFKNRNTLEWKKKMFNQEVVPVETSFHIKQLVAIKWYMNK